VTKQVQEKHLPNTPIVTTLEPATTFFDAEEYHQFYLENNPDGYAVSSSLSLWLVNLITNYFNVVSYSLPSLVKEEKKREKSIQKIIVLYSPPPSIFRLYFIHYIYKHYYYNFIIINYLL
jgi:hypothetical protein